VWRVRAIGWAGATLKFVEHKPQRFGGLLCYERQAALPWADCTPRAAQERARLQKAFSMAKLSPWDIFIIKRMNCFICSKN
jgi:hypothetical protein